MCRHRLPSITQPCERTWGECCTLVRVPGAAWSASSLTSVCLLWLLATILREASRDIIFRCVAHHVKVVATPRGSGVTWTPSLFPEVLNWFYSLPWSLAACGCHSYTAEVGGEKKRTDKPIVKARPVWKRKKGRVSTGLDVLVASLHTLCRRLSQCDWAE